MSFTREPVKIHVLRKVIHQYRAIAERAASVCCKSRCNRENVPRKGRDVRWGGWQEKWHRVFYVAGLLIDTVLKGQRVDTRMRSVSPPSPPSVGPGERCKTFSTASIE